MNLVQRQIASGSDPRSLLQSMLPPSTTIPDELDDITLWKIIIGIVNEPPRRRKLPHVKTLNDVLSLLQTCNKIIVLTGAGVGRAWLLKLLIKSLTRSHIIWLSFRFLYRVVFQTSDLKMAYMPGWQRIFQIFLILKLCLIFSTLKGILVRSISLQRYGKVLYLVTDCTSIRLGYSLMNITAF